MSKPRKQRPPQEASNTSIPETPQFSTKFGIRKSVRIIPRNIHQEDYLAHLMDSQKMIVLAHGPAGCGKSVMAMLAAIKALSEKKVSKIILCRPSVGVEDENLGFLPGTVQDKLAPWVQPLVDVLAEYYSNKELSAMIENNVVEFLPLMYMRGRNIKDAFVILDEAQNASISQCKAVFTRLCDNSKLVVTGDNDQSDRKQSENGLLFFKKALADYGGSSYISSVEFNQKDIERHAVVSEVLDIFKSAGK